MVFSSAPFIFCFLPVVFILYSLIPRLKGRNVLLVIASLFFYAYGEPVFVLIMIGSVTVNYLLTRVIVKQRRRDSATGEWVGGKGVAALAVCINVAILCVFKYADFGVNTLNGILGIHIPEPNIGLPIGISFFTFQALSYVIDVYRQPETMQRNFGKVLLYISFFPQLIAGPIVKYHDIAGYLNERHTNPDEIRKGIYRFVIGLAKKMLLANTMGEIANQLLALPAGDMSTATAWIGSCCFAMQVFFDFSGYSDMAIGLGHMFGFTFRENFDHPYISTSIKEFWKRNHISLTTWFREYVYFPLGGNRKGKVRAMFNKLIVFFMTGLWHGASWNFVAWGMIHGVAMLAEDACHRERHLQKLKWVGWIYTMIILMGSFPLFWGGLQPGTQGEIWVQSLASMKNMFVLNPGNDAAYNACMKVLNPINITTMIVVAFACIPHPKIKHNLLERSELVAAIFILVVFVLCLLNLSSGSFNPFIYFRF